MIIKTVQVGDTYKDIKYKVYDLVRKLNSQTGGIQHNLVVVFVVQLLLLFPFSAIMFKHHDHFPSLFSNIFRVFLLTNLEQQFGVKLQIISALVIVYTIIIFVLTILHFLLQNVPTSITSALNFMIIFAHCLIVPLTDFAVNNFLVATNPDTSMGSKAMSFISVFLIFFTLSISCLKIFLDLRVLRKRTTFWNLTNCTHLKLALFFILKTIYINIKSTSLLGCLMSLGFWCLLIQEKEATIRETERNIEMSLINYTALVDVCVLISIATAIPEFAVRLWIFSLLFLAAAYIIMIIRSKERKLFLPTCSSPPELFYDFFYSCCQELKGEEFHDKNLPSNNSELFHLHRFQCPRQTCKLSQWQSMSQSTLESIITTILKEKSTSTLQNRIIFNLWELELGRSCKLSWIESKQLTIPQEFLIYYINKITKVNDVVLQNKAKESKQISNTFYDLIYEIAGYYVGFYQTLAKAEPSVDTIEYYGMLIANKMEVLSSVYNQLVKKKLLNFKMIEVYIQFITRFVSQDALTKEDIARLSKIQTPPFDDISENCLPTLTLYPETGKIENGNSEAQKLMKMTRFELKSNSIQDLTQPKLTLDIIQDILLENEHKEEEPNYIFFNPGQKSIILGKIKVAERLLKGKKLLVMEIQQNIFSSQKNAFLIDDDFQMCLSQCIKVRVRKGPYRSSPLQMCWEDLFEKELSLHKEKILRTKMVKIPISQTSCVLVVKRLKCAIPTYHILQAEVHFSDESIRVQKTSTRIFSLKKNLPNKPFQFHYIDTQNDDKSILIGRRGTEEELRSRDNINLTNFLRQSLGGLCQEKAIDLFPDYGKNIKTYRLFEGDLYNIELQAKQAYYQEFEGKEPLRQKMQIEKNTSFQSYSLVGVIIMVVILITISTFFIIYCQSTASTVDQEMQSYSNIESLFIDFTRIMGLLRDLFTGFSSKFPHISINNEIDDSYNRIKVLKKKPLFTSKQYSMNFTGIEIIGTMPQLLDVVLAHTHELLSKGNYSIVPEILITGLRFIALMEDILHQSPIKQQLSTLEFYKVLCFYISIALLVLLVTLIFYFIYRSHLKVVSHLTALLLMADSECNIHQENASKIRYAVQMIRKQYDGDLKDLMFIGSENKRRKHPKKVAFCSEIIVTVLVLIIIALGIHLGCMAYFQSHLTNSIERYHDMKHSMDELTEVYFESAEISNQIYVKGQTDLDDIEKLIGINKFLTYHMGSYPFSPTLNQFIHTIYYQNSCSLLSSHYNVSVEVCHMTAPQFTLKNPFQMGLFYYLTRQQYYFFSNVTEIYSHASIYSKIFVQIMTDITIMMGDECIMVVREASNVAIVMSYVIIVIDAGYIIAFILMHTYFRRQLNSIRVIVDLFRKRMVKKEKKKEEINENDEIIQSDESDEEENGSDEELLQSNQKLVQVRNHRRKRTTIQSNLPFIDLHLS